MSLICLPGMDGKYKQGNGRILWNWKATHVSYYYVLHYYSQTEFHLWILLGPGVSVCFRELKKCLSIAGTV